MCGDTNNGTPLSSGEEVLFIIPADVAAHTQEGGRTRGGGGRGREGRGREGGRERRFSEFQKLKIEGEIDKQYLRLYPNADMGSGNEAIAYFSFLAILKGAVK